MAADLEARGVEVIRGDIRDADARRQALEGQDNVVHLAAIVGDPACGRDPELSNSINVEGSKALVADAREYGIKRLVFASTCSNYGRMDDPTVPDRRERPARRPSPSTRSRRWASSAPCSTATPPATWT